MGALELAPYYPQLGRPSIDPVLMIRMLIIGYVFAIRSERALSRDAQVNLIVGFAGSRLKTRYDAQAVSRATKEYLVTLDDAAFFERAIDELKEKVPFARTAKDITPTCNSPSTRAAIVIGVNKTGYLPILSARHRELNQLPTGSVAKASTSGTNRPFSNRQLMSSRS